MRRLLVSGVGLRGDGYPNAERTLEILRESGNWEVHDRADWLPVGTRLWSVARETFGKRARLILRLASSSALRALVSMLSSDSRGALIYLPYPALFTLWWVSFVPRRWRARYIADAYLSIWDSMFRDRCSHRRHGLTSGLVYGFEGRALRAANLVLTDTEANRELLIRDFALNPERVRSAPLAIDEDHFRSVGPARPKSGPLRVLFVGTLIPLHGVSVVLDAMRALGDDTRFEFRLIGDGQLSDEVEEFLGRNPLPRLTWIREWCPLDRIATEIGAADICLGVFGGSGKAARVLPFKVYMYLAAGRAVVTQAEMSLPAGTPYPPVAAIDINQAGALASALVSLAEAPDQRLGLASAAREYYGRWLANSRIAAFWESI